MAPFKGVGVKGTGVGEGRGGIAVMAHEKAPAEARLGDADRASLLCRA